MRGAPSEGSTVRPGAYPALPQQGLADADNAPLGYLGRSLSVNSGIAPAPGLGARRVGEHGRSTGGVSAGLTTVWEPTHLIDYLEATMCEQSSRPSENLLRDDAADDPYRRRSDTRR